ncbi:MAG: hypothetical protein ABIZ64_06265, partial [Casimicrobium sp.]
FGFTPTAATAAAYGGMSTDYSCSYGSDVVALVAKNAATKLSDQGGVSLDIDGDGTVNPLVDGLLLWRAYSGARGAALTAGINFPSSATRQTPASIESYLRLCNVDLAP